MGAEACGWGKPEDQRDNQTTTTVDHVRLTCHAVVAPLFKAFLEECVERGYSLDEQADDWGYAFRKIRGSQTAWSNHAWGLAIDVNATRNPMREGGDRVTDMPRWMQQLGQAKYGLRWGGAYTGPRVDPMHWEVIETPAQVKTRIAALKALKPAPASEEDDFMGKPSEWTDADKTALVEVGKRILTAAFTAPGSKSSGETVGKLITAVAGTNDTTGGTA